MKNIFTDLNCSILDCCAKLNNLYSTIIDSVLYEKYSLCEKTDSKEFYDFISFKESVSTLNYKLRLFSDNKEWNFEHQLTRKALDNIPIAREHAETAIKDVNTIIKLTKNPTIKKELKQSINFMIKSINIYYEQIREYFAENLSKLEYNNLIKLYNLTDLTLIN